MVGFDSVPFYVLTSDSTLPLPAREDGSGVYYYAPRVLSRSREDYIALQDLFSPTTVNPALGPLDTGVAVVERGVGVRTLVYPDGSDEITVDAILVSILPQGRSLDQIGYVSQLRFFIAEAIV